MGTEPEGEPNVMFSRLAPVFSSMSATGTLDSLKTSLDAPLSTTIFQMTAVFSVRSSAKRRPRKDNPDELPCKNWQSPLDFGRTTPCLLPQQTTRARDRA